MMKFSDIKSILFAEKRTTPPAARERGIWYHGTSTAFAKSILSQGLKTDSKKKVWDEDPHVGRNSPSLVSYGGIYLTSNLSKATGAASMAQKKHDKDNRRQSLLVILEIQPRSLFVDEDKFVSVLKDIPYTAQYVYFSYKYGHLNKYEKEENERRWKNSLEKYIEIFMGYSNLTDAHPSLKNRLKELLKQAWEKALTRSMAYTKEGDREWERNYQGIAGTSEDPPPIPNKAEAEKEFRDIVDQLTRTLKKHARPSMSNSMFPSGRIMNDIGFKGSNRIVSIVLIDESKRFEDGKPHIEQPHELYVLYGTPPQEFFDDYGIQIAKKYVVKKGFPKDAA